MYAHRLRARYDAVLVGRVTVSKDDPELTVRHVKGRNPVRIVLDPDCSLNLSKKIFNTGKAYTVLCTKRSSAAKNRKMISETKERGVTVLLMKDLSFLSFRRLLRRLYSLGITSILVEGGGRTISSFVDSGVIQRLHLFIAPIMLGKGIPLFQRRKSLYISASESFSLKKTSKFNGDLYAEWEVER